MAPDPDAAGTRPAWFVGAAFGGGTDDKAERFIREGVWEHGFRDRWIDEVKSIHVDDRIAIKSTYTKKHGLPFDNRGHSVAVMAIKAVGVVTGNPGDGRHLTVDWASVKPHREWYFYTHLPTVWRVVPHNYVSRSLIDFTFEGQDQDIDKFRNFPYWRDRFGDNPTSDDRFPWTTFYSRFADKLLAFRQDRMALLRHRMVIDTKFTSILKPGYRRPLTLDRGHIFQMYAYLRSQESVSDPGSLDSSGLLLHPSVGKDVDESAVIQGHRIRFATVDLAADSTAIRARLIALADEAAASHPN